MKIGIIRSTGSSQGDMVLKGIYGQFAAGEVEGGIGTFQIAPEFRRISHLFSYLDSGASPVVPRDIAILEVEESQEHLAKAQLMHAMATRWGKMYESVTPQQPGVMTAMLAGESRQVANGAKSHLVSMGMRAYLVPITCEMTTYEPGSFIATERDLVACLREPRNITLAEGDPVDLGTDVLVTSLQSPARDEATPVAVGEAAAARPWADGQYEGGIVATISGSMLVIAPSAEKVREAAELALKLHAQASDTGVQVEILPEAIQSMRPFPVEETAGDPDFDDDPDFDRDRG